MRERGWEEGWSSGITALPGSGITDAGHTAHKVTLYWEKLKVIVFVIAFQKLIIKV